MIDNSTERRIHITTKYGYHSSRVLEFYWGICLSYTFSLGNAQEAKRVENAAEQRERRKTICILEKDTAKLPLLLPR